MTKDELRKAVELANKLVEAMPEWKKHILENSGKATVSVPRKPVIDSQWDCY